MKTFLITFLGFFLFGLFATSCKKNMTLDGEYEGVFTGVYTPPFEHIEIPIVYSYIITISNASKTRCEFAQNYFTNEMSIKKNVIFGDFDVRGFGLGSTPSNIMINGVFDKEDGKFKITGEFTEIGNKIFQENDSTFFYYTKATKGTFMLSQK